MKRLCGQCAKGLLGIGLVLAMLLASLPVLAEAREYKVTRASKIYQNADKSSKVLATAQKGDTLAVSQIKGQWAQVKSNGKAGYILKSALKKASDSSASASSGTTVKQVQNRLVAKGYLKASAATGSSNAATGKAIRIFQMMNGLKVTGSANTTTVKKIMSSSARKRSKVNSATWAKSGIGTRFKKGGTAAIIDMATGARLKIRRVGGHYHLDVEPCTASDTATLKRVYGGTWSWDSRPVLLIAGGRFYAAAMNGMPHGDQISTTNNFDGQFCVHLKGSLTHGTEKVNSYHQSNVNKVIAYFR